MATRVPSVMDFPLIHSAFNSVSFSWFWLVLRVYVGYEWLEAGRHKVVDSAWMDGGAALKGYWERAVAIPEEGRPQILYGWYRDFLQFMLDREWYTWFAPLVAVGELLVGIALIAGVFVGFAALTGAFMNTNYLLAGTASSNPVLLILALLLAVAWRVSGYWGFDRFLLKVLGTPWNPGVLVQRILRRPAYTAGLGHRI